MHNPSNPKARSPGVMSRRQVMQAGAVAAASVLADGIAEAQASETAIKPFEIALPQAAIDDLKRRLHDIRWPETETEPGWAQGVPLDQLQRLADHWRRDYEWRRCEARINAFPQFRLKIDGLDFHFLHVRSKHPRALPMILTHGWPGSVIEFLKVIGPLTDPVAHGGSAEDAFHVVIPSLPGFGFSEKPSGPGWDAVRIARAWAELMQALGYTRWVAQGGDIGAVVTNTLALQRPAGLVAVHLNLPLAVPADLQPQTATAEEQAALAALRRFLTDGFGYSLLQATRPQTIGYALADSPIGLAAWLYEKFEAWTDRTDGGATALTIDEILDDITLYWLTNTAASSARIYRENAKLGMNQGVVDFPVGISIFPKEIFATPRSWADKVYPNIIHWNELPRGGHFAAFEQPALFAQELRDCFRSLRNG